MMLEQSGTQLSWGVWCTAEEVVKKIKMNSALL